MIKSKKDKFKIFHSFYLFFKIFKMLSNSNFQDKRENQNCIEIIKKYSFLFKDTINIYCVQELILCNKDDTKNFVELFRLGNEISNMNEGQFSINLNNKFIIVNENFKRFIKEYCEEFIFIIRKSIINENVEIINTYNCFHILLLINFILIFSPEFYTLYRIKKEILNKHELDFKSELFYKDIYLSEFLFINIINESNRKCSISWDYRYFLIKEFNIKISEQLKNFDYCNNINLLVKSLKTIFEILKISPVISKHHLLLFDLFLISRINEKEKRNYHLWKYIIKLNKFYHGFKDKVILLSFCLNILFNNPFDYSAYSNSINIYANLKFNEKIKFDLKNYMEYVMNLNKIDSSSYFNDFISKIQN